MIISAQEGGLALVRQDDHMGQCGELADRWGGSFEAPPQAGEVRLAVAHHDWGWTPVDDALPYHEATGRPRNFHEFDLEEHARFYEQGYRKVLERSRYAGLLVGMHWIGLYRSRYGYDPTLTLPVPERLRASMDARILRLEHELLELRLACWDSSQSRGAFEAGLWMGYEWLQVLDRMSLYMSLGHPGRAAVETAVGTIRPALAAPAVEIRVAAPGDGRLLVDPFPFAEPFVSTVRRRHIPDLDYAGPAQLEAALAEAQPEPLEWMIAPKRR
ncbi:DUF3891 family protein [Paenibacillus sp. IB182496]|uniref:DUF3891 family protein n=1 Tax=Paenibacillus sabuli TaxID=2772509 RepID=A0A927BQT5_9BACL|nr:DUF3891 family protein [Paenibacillus sabuli]MBD2843788.1 DUF3891 family protein [Paenibacillus sabuli]